MISLELFYKATDELKKEYDGSQGTPFPSDVADDKVLYFVKLLKFNNLFELVNLKLPFNRKPDRTHIYFSKEESLCITVLMGGLKNDQTF